MIKHLNGIHEMVDYKAGTQICLYYNDENENYPPHWHISYELIMPIVNTYEVICGRKTFCLREGDILVICPGTIHELFAPPSGKRIIFQPNLSHIFIKELELLTSMISPSILITPEEYPLIYDKVRQLMLEIKNEYFKSESYMETTIVYKFLEILVSIGRSRKKFVGKNGEAAEVKQKKYLEKFILITEYINEHFAEDISLEKVASIAGFSKYHFTRLFKQYTDVSFYKYLNQRRIDHAKLLLLDPGISVIEVATQSGFSSLSAFLRMFKQLNGCTPTEFRNIYE